MATIERNRFFPRLSISVWRILTSSWLVVGVLVTGAAIFAANVWVPQIPRALLSDTNKVNQWLGSVPSAWYRVIPTLNILGLTHLANSPLVTLFLVFVVVICALHTLTAFNAAWVSPGHRLYNFTWQTSKGAGLPSSLETAAMAAGMTVQPVTLRIRTDPEVEYYVLSNSQLIRWWWLGLLVGVSILASTYLVNSVSRDNTFQAAPGDKIVLPRPSSTALVLDSLVTATLGSGQTAVTTSNWIIEPAVGSRSFSLAYEKPLFVNGSYLYLIGWGPALKVKATDSTGKPVKLVTMPGGNIPEASVSLRFTPGEQEQYVGIPDQNLLLRLTNYASLPSQGLDKRVVALQLYKLDTGELVQQTLVEQFTVLAMQGFEMEFSLDQYAEMLAQPWYLSWLNMAGLLFTFSAAIAVNLKPKRFVWAAFTNRALGTSCSLWYARQDSQQAWLQSLQESLQEATNAVD